MFKKILIANRGEIACRVIETCRRLNIETVAVYSTADRRARHVALADEAFEIGGPRPSESYLRGERIIEVARSSGAEAIHPGYGFLSENAAFARQCAEAGVVFIGPSAEAIDRMGSKSAAKRLMADASVPVVPGYHGDNQDPKFLAAEAQRTGFPLLIKAVAGGGGKGMRLVQSAKDFLPQLEAARREAKNAFGDDAVLIERFVQGPHHIEFQVFGDRHGNVVHINERECSIQRRHQKIVEETPSPFLDDDLRRRMGAAAVAAAKAIDYVGAGTIEFIVGADREFYFMEMNTRLQVEHPVTEMTSGLDLVEWQLRVAAGQPLPLAQQDIQPRGHAIEVRLYAENPDKGFLPETGIIERWIHPATGAGLRIDTGVVEGDAIGVHYDPMIAKLIVAGATRDEAVRRLQQALSATAVCGLITNIPFLARLARHPAFVAGQFDTLFIEHHLPELRAHAAAAPDMAYIAAAITRVALDEGMPSSSDPASPWNRPNGWRMNATIGRAILFADPGGGTTREMRVGGHGGRYRVSLGERDYEVEADWGPDGRLALACEGRRLSARVIPCGLHYVVVLDGERHELEEIDRFVFESAEEGSAGRLTAAMPGRIVQVHVKEGEPVSKGQPLLILEAMKMEHTVHSPREGRIEQVYYKVDDVVEADAVLFAFADQ